MNSAQYHEEDFFVQVNYRDDKILPFQRQLSNIALLFAIRSILPITVHIKCSKLRFQPAINKLFCKILAGKKDLLELYLINKQEIEK